MVVAVAGIAEPVLAAPSEPEAPAQAEPDMPDAEGTDVDPVDLDRDQELVEESTEVVEEAAEATKPEELPAGALDGMADLAPDVDESQLLQDDDGDGVVHPPPPDIDVTGGVEVVEDPNVDPALVGPETPADLEPAWDEALADLGEKAQTIDIDEYEEGEEIPELRTEGSQTFRGEGNQLRTQLSTQSLFAENAEGELVEPSSEPVGSRDGRWRPEAGYDGASVASSADDDQLASLGFQPGQVISWSLDGADDVPGVPTDDGVRYDEVLDGVDLELKVTASGIKETLVLADASAPTVYDFPLNVSGLTLQTSDRHDAIVLADSESGEPVGVIPGAWAVDSGVGPGGGPPDPVPVAYEIVGSGDDVVLRLKVNESWLKNPARTFPVTIDPTALDYRMTNDSWINSGYPSSTGGATTAYLKAGYADGAKRSYFAKWDVNGLSNTAIIEAVYKTFLNYSWTCTPKPFQVYRVTEDWSPGTVSWYDQPSYYNRAPLAQYNVSGGRPGCAAKWLTNAPIRSLVQGWVDGTVPNQGLTGRVAPNDNYSDSGTYKVFNSSESGGVGGQLLEITWSYYRAGYAAGALSVPSNNTAGSMDVRVTNKSKLTWNKAGSNPYKLTYHLFASNGTTLVTKDAGRASLPTDLAPGQSVWVTIPLAPNDPGNWKYKFEMVRDITAAPNWDDHFFSGEGFHPDLTAMTVPVRINNLEPVLTELEPAGHVDKPGVQLRALAKDPDAWPGDPLEYLFKICTDIDMTQNCKSNTWSGAKTWPPPNLRWGKTYYWNVAVREGNGSGGRATNMPDEAAVSFTPSVPQPKVEQHFGSDPYSQTYGGVNPSIGNYVTSFTDVQVASAGLSVDLTRTYNSMDTRVGAFGPGWSTAIDTTATVEPNGRLLIKYPDGRQERYAQNSSDGTTPGDWVGGPGNNSVLEKLGEDGWLLTRPDKAVYKFDGEERLIEVHDSAGHKLLLAYPDSTSRKVTSITNQVSNRSISFTWANEGPSNAPVVKSATALPAPGAGPAPKWTYTYASGLLTSACAPPESDPDCTEYSYWGDGENNGRKGKLKTVTKPTGLETDTPFVQLDYGVEGRVASATNALGKTWTFNDDDDAVEGTYHPITGWSAGTRTGLADGVTITQDLNVAGAPGMPASGVQAVVVDVGVSNATTNGWLSLYPNGTSEPSNVSTMDYWGSGDVRSTLQTVAVSDDGGIKITAHGGTVDLNFEVVGWYGESGMSGGSVFVPLTTKKIFDSRTVEDGDDPIGANETKDIQITGKGGIPTDGVTAVVYDLEGINPTATTWLTAFPKGETRPSISTLWLNSGRHTDNLAITKVGTDGKISLYNKLGDIDVELNVVGYFTDPAVRDGLVFRPVTNARLLDSRFPGGQWASPWPAATTRSVSVAGLAGLPTRGVGAVVGEYQGFKPAAATYLLTSPAGSSGTSGATNIPQVNKALGNQFYAGLGDNGAFDLKTASQPMDMIIDITGYFTPIPRTTIVEDPRGNQVEFRFDSLGRLVSRIDEDDYAELNFYNDEGMLSMQVEPDSGWAYFEYDDKGRLSSQMVSRLSPNLAPIWEAKTRFGYIDDEANKARDGKLLWVSDPRSPNATDTAYRTTYEYDDKGQPTKVTGPSIDDAPGVGVVRTYTDGTEPAVGSDGTMPAGLLETSTDAANLVTKYSYDKRGDLRRVEHPSATGTDGLRKRRDEFTYDALGRPIQQQQISSQYPAPGLTTDRVYDDQGRVTEETGPLVTGLIQHPVEGKDHRTRITRVYDADGRVHSETEKDLIRNVSREIVFTYDALGHVTDTEDSTGRRTHRDYDAMGNLDTQEGVDGLTIDYDYNARNLLTTAKAVDLELDPISHPGVLSDMTLASYSYDGAGRRTTEVDANGRLVNHIWRADGRLEASIAGNLRSTDAATGAPTSAQRTMLLGGASLDPAGHPLEQYEPTDISHQQSSWTSLTGWTAGTPGNWAGTSTTISSSTLGVLRRDGRSDGSVEVVAAGPAPLLPAFRITPARNRYHRVALAGTSLKVQALNPNGVTGTVTLAEATLAQPIAAGDRIAAVFVGPRIWVLVNGAVVLDAHSSADVDESGVGIAQAGSGTQSTRSFRFDAYRQTTNSYDGYGRIEESTFDPGGADQRTVWTRLPDGRPTKVSRFRATDPTGLAQAVGYEYDSATGALDKEHTLGLNDVPIATTDVTIDDRGLTTQVVTPELRTVTTTYDQLGRPLQVVAPQRAVEVFGQPATNVTPTTTFGYSSFGRPAAAQNAAGQLTWERFDDRGNAIETVLPPYTPPSGTPQARSTTSTYDVAGRPLSTTDIAGKTTNFTYNSLGQLVRQLDPAVGSDPRGDSRFEYDNVGRLTKQTDPLDAAVESVWDDLDRLVATRQQVTQPSGSPATFVQARTFGNGGGLLGTHSAEGVVTTAGYDVAGRLVRTADADGNATTYSYDELSRLANVIGPDNRRVQTSYNVLGDKSAEAYLGPAGEDLGTSTFEWNKDHQLTASRTPETEDKNRPATTFVYDAGGQLVSRTTPVEGYNIVEEWGYDLLGRATKYEDGRNNQTWQTYNAMGLPEDSIASAVGAQTVADRRWRTVYDTSGRPTTQSSPGGISVSTTYDELGRPKQVSGSGAEASTETRSYEYDRLGQVKKVSTPAGAQNFTYDERGMLLSATGGSGDSWFSYDGDGRVTQRVDSSGTSSFTYDNRGLPDTMTSSLGGQVSFDFDPAGRPTTVNFGSNSKRTFTYGPSGNVQSDKLTTGTGPTPAVLYGTDYGYDLDGNITTKTTSGTGVPAAGTNTYEYDWASRLKKWSGPGTTPQSYTWDEASNRLAAGSTTATYDPQNRLTQTSSPDGQTNFTWNPNGTMDTQSVQPAQRKVTLVVANPASLTAAESAVSNRLSTAGAIVSLVDDAAAASATNVDVVVIAPTVDAAVLADKYKTIGVPVVNLAAATWQASGVTNAAPASASGTSAHVAEPTHPVAAGKTGTVTVLSASNTLSNAPASSLGSGATKVLVTASGSTNTVAAAYDTGATTPAGAAPARRVTLGLSAGATTSFTADGWAVFDAAITWADNNPLKAGSTGYDFDAFEQLKKVTPPSGAASTYTYDPLGRRLSSPTGALTYSGTAIRPSSDGVTRYQPGVLGTIAVDDMTNGGGQWAHADGHTDVVGLFTPGATTLAGSQTFSPWGQPMGTTGTPSPLGYQSERQDLPGGLVGMGVREYNPTTATFISHDPITDPAVPNGYSYTSSNPMGQTDPTGMCKLDGVRGGFGYIWAGRPGCNGLQTRAFDTVLRWCRTGVRNAVLSFCKDEGRGLFKLNARAYDFVAMCGSLIQGCPSTAPSSNGPSGSGTNPNGSSGNSSPGSSTNGPSGSGSNGGGSSGSGGTPGGSGADAGLLANTPPAPPSGTAALVAATGSAVPNYPGRFQRDSSGQIRDTGTLSVNTAPATPTSVTSSNLVQYTTPQVIQQGVTEEPIPGVNSGPGPHCNDGEWKISDAMFCSESDGFDILGGAKSAAGGFARGLLGTWETGRTLAVCSHSWGMGDECQSDTQDMAAAYRQHGWKMFVPCYTEWDANGDAAGAGCLVSAGSQAWAGGKVIPTGAKAGPPSLVDDIATDVGASSSVAHSSATGLARVPDFVNEAAAFRHYSKHVKGLEMLSKGRFRLKDGGADMPEFGSFTEYRNSARSFMSADAAPGVLQGYRGTDLVRFDPKTGYFGVVKQDGTIRTFFRPDGDGVAYFWDQFL